jgi:hypothetical protein
MTAMLAVVFAMMLAAMTVMTRARTLSTIALIAATILAVITAAAAAVSGGGNSCAERLPTIVVGIGERIHVDALDRRTEPRFDCAGEDHLAIDTLHLSACKTAAGKKKCKPDRNTK